MVTARVYVDGVDVTASTLSGLTIRHGRSDLRSQPDAPTCSLTLSGSAVPPVGAQVTVNAVVDVGPELVPSGRFYSAADAAAWESGNTSGTLALDTEPDWWRAVSLTGVPAGHAWMNLKQRPTSRVPMDAGVVHRVTGRFRVTGGPSRPATVTLERFDPITGAALSAVPVWSGNVTADVPVVFDVDVSSDVACRAGLLIYVNAAGVVSDLWAADVSIRPHVPTTLRRFTGNVTDVAPSFDVDTDGTLRPRVDVVAAAPVAALGHRWTGDTPAPSELDGARAARILADSNGEGTYLESRTDHNGYTGGSSDGLYEGFFDTTVRWSRVGNVWQAVPVKVDAYGGSACAVAPTVGPFPTGDVPRTITRVRGRGVRCDGEVFYGPASIDRLDDGLWHYVTCEPWRARSTADDADPWLYAASVWFTIDTPGGWLEVDWTGTLVDGAPDVWIDWTADPGTVAVVAVDGTQPGDALSLLDSIGEDAAALVAYRRGGTVEYQDANRRGPDVSPSAFLDAATILASQFTPGQDVGGVVNDVEVRYGVDGSGVFRVVDEESVAARGRFQVSLSTQLAGAPDAADLATRIVGRLGVPRWSTPTTRVPVWWIDEGTAHDVLALDVSDLVAWELPPSLSMLEPVQWCEGWDDRVDWRGSRCEWTVALSLSDRSRFVAPVLWRDVDPGTTWAAAVGRWLDADRIADAARYVGATQPIGPEDDA